LTWLAATLVVMTVAVVEMAVGVTMETIGHQEIGVKPHDL